MTPFAKEPMDSLSITSPVERVVLRFAAQIAKTEIALNWIGYMMDHAPAPMLITVPTLEVRKRWIIQRLNPMLEASKTLSDIFNAKRKRDGANTEEMKDFPGGFLVIGGANSPASLASMPIKYVINDEIDRFPWEVGKGGRSEGDPLGLIRERQKTFPRRKELDASTPTMRGVSRIDELFESSDQRYFHLPCPHCDELIVLNWSADPKAPKNGQLKWTTDPTTRAPARVVYICGHCGAEIEEHHKTKMLADGIWIPRYPERSNYSRGYHLNALYSPIGLGFKWIELVRMWLDAQDDKAKLKRFINTTLAESFEDRSREVKADALRARAEPYALREIPIGCLTLTCGIDVQDDRLHLLVVGWGAGESCWFIDRLVLPGDPQRMLDEASLGRGPLVTYLNTPFVNRFRRKLFIQATGIDTGGHHTHDVYAFVRSRKARRLMAVKGANKPGRPILGARPESVDVNWRGKIFKGGVTLWMVGTDTAKSAFFSRLIGDTEELNRPLDDERPLHQLKIHFSEALDDDFYSQITSEVFDPGKNRWVLMRNRRNEDLDCWVYAAAAAQHPELRLHARRPADWEHVRQSVETPAPEDEGNQQQHGGEARDKPASKKQSTTKKKRGGGFVKGWR